jgi:hypothetical protein
VHLAICNRQSSCVSIIPKFRERCLEAAGVKEYFCARSLMPGLYCPISGLCVVRRPTLGLRRSDTEVHRQLVYRVSGLLTQYQPGQVYRICTGLRQRQVITWVLNTFSLFKWPRIPLVIIRMVVLSTNSYKK